jgi:hypothetical protein
MGQRGIDLLCRKYLPMELEVPTTRLDNGLLVITNNNKRDNDDAQINVLPKLAPMPEFSFNKLVILTSIKASVRIFMNLQKIIIWHISHNAN